MSQLPGSDPTNVAPNETAELKKQLGDALKAVNDLRSEVGRLKQSRQPEPTQIPSQQRGAPSAVAGAEVDLVDLIENNPQEFERHISSRAAETMMPYLNGLGDAVFTNAVTAATFFNDPEKGHRRTKAFRQNVMTKVREIYQADPNLPLEEALERGEQLIASDLEQLGYKKSEPDTVQPPTQQQPFTPAASQPGAVAEGGSAQPGRAPSAQPKTLAVTDEQQVDDYVADLDSYRAK
jgi:hypothetical protein